MESGDLITIDPEILGGVAVFKGTRVPINSLFEYLENDYSLRNSWSAFLRSPATRHVECWNALSRCCFLARENFADDTRDQLLPQLLGINRMDFKKMVKRAVKTKTKHGAKRDLFAELNEGMKAFAEERLGKRKLRTSVLTQETNQKRKV